MSYIFLDPDGTQQNLFGVVIEKPTRIFYASQCAGLANDTKVTEGFYIPLGSLNDDESNMKGARIDGLQALIIWFKKTFHGNSYEPATKWSETQLSELRTLVSNIVCFYTTDDKDDRDERCFLQFDEDRLQDCTEAWIPVLTPYGRGILVFPNCD